MQDKLNKCKAFKDSPLYSDFLALGREYYDGAFTEAMNSNLSSEERVSKLEYMKGIGLMLNIFNILENDYEEQITREEAKDE